MIQEGDYLYEKDEKLGGWIVKVADKNKEKYQPIPSTKDGLPVVSLAGAFALCHKMTESPKIPYRVKDLSYAFTGCISLKYGPKIPSRVRYMEGAFQDCTALEEDMWINANPARYDRCFAGTKKEIYLNGTSRKLYELALTADNHNVFDATAGHYADEDVDFLRADEWDKHLYDDD